MTRSPFHRKGGLRAAFAFDPGPVMSASSLKPVQELKALELFAEALDLPLDEREAWLARACGDDPALHERVQSLLAVDATAHESALSCEAPVVPNQIGHYRLEEWVGSGGMGSVYRAQRVDGLFEQTVAIKFVRQARGLENLQPLIEAERKTLARMDHPGIARILDGGTTEQGLQYLIMEFVRGVPLNQFLLGNGVPLRERIRLFREVCAAVGHAHENLVLHCDLKPENILVDREGRTRLIDFGVARLKDVIDPQRPDGYTRGYTSPQRLEGHPATVTDDIYALGKVLEECIDPSEATRRSDGWAVRELRAIGRKASAEKREDRYPTVAALDADLAAWTELRPVAAIGHHSGYRLRKLMQRHPWRLIAAGGALLALIAALVIISAQYTRAEQARNNAERRFGEVRSLASFVLFDLYDRLGGLSQSLTLRRDVAALGQHYLSTLASDVNASTDLQIEALQGLVRLAAVQGGNSGAQLGQFAEAQKNLDEADTIATRLQSRGLVAWRLAALRAEILLQQAHLSADIQNDVRTADQRLAAARTQLDHALADPAHDAGVVRTDLGWFIRAATNRLWEGRYDDALRLADQAKEELASLRPAAATDRADKILEGSVYDLIATATFYAGDHQGAISPYQKELSVLESAAASLPEDVEISRSLARARWALGTTLLDVGRAADALPLTHAAMATAQKLVARDADDNDARRLQSITELAYAQALAAKGATGDALNEFAAIIERRRLVAVAQPRDVSLTRAYAIALFARGDVYSDARQSLNACRDYHAGFETFKRLKDEGLLTQLDNDYALKQAKQRAESLRCEDPGA